MVCGPRLILNVYVVIKTSSSNKQKINNLNCSKLQRCLKCGRIIQSLIRIFLKQNSNSFRFTARSIHWSKKCHDTPESNISRCCTSQTLQIFKEDYWHMTPEWYNLRYMCEVWTYVLANRRSYYLPSCKQTSSRLQVNCSQPPTLYMEKISTFQHQFN